jgi:hypothetical protein
MKEQGDELFDKAVEFAESMNRVANKKLQTAEV